MSDIVEPRQDTGCVAIAGVALLALCLGCSSVQHTSRQRTRIREVSDAMRFARANMEQGDPVSAAEQLRRAYLTSQTLPAHTGSAESVRSLAGETFDQLLQKARQEASSGQPRRARELARSARSLAETFDLEMKDLDGFDRQIAALEPAAPPPGRREAASPPRVSRATSGGFRPRQVHAVVIGIDKYHDAAIRPLRYAARDAKLFRNHLVDHLDVPADQVTSLLDEQATLTAMKAAMGIKLKANVRRGDMALIYFAGHGAPEVDNASPDADGLEKYLLPWDADSKQLFATAFSMDEMKKIFGRLESERVVCVLDACHSGATKIRSATRGLGGVTTDATLRRVTQGRGRMVLAAARAGQYSQESDELKHGVFTYCLVDALQGKGDFNGDGYVSIHEAYQYLSREVPRRTTGNQHPVFKGEFEGEIFLGRAN